MNHTTNPLIAHVRRNPDDSWAEPHLLHDHLKGTAERAARFAAIFNSESWGRLLGLAHDLGKATPEWQQYLLKKSGFDRESAHLEGIAGKLEHTDTSAICAKKALHEEIAKLIAYCIAGHHTGLPDWEKTSETSGSGLKFRLSNSKARGVSAEWLTEMQEVGPLVPPWKFDNAPLSLSLWIRMLFSCLVDADFLDTEAYMRPDSAELRAGYKPIDELMESFNAYMETKTISSVDTPVNRLRREVLRDCREAALEKPGIFSLTVPTGGGKTLSSLAFGLEHAVKWKKDRIIYVIPYTSIIEQNADVFRDVLGDEQVVEHHSAIGEDASTPQARLAAENWDAPIIVTTSVQFFESLFAAKTSRCRKLHNIANSVVVLDEAQLLPTDFLQPILHAMNLLAQQYRVTFVISTATQPALNAKHGFKGLTDVREIVRDVSRLYQELRRVNVDFPTNLKTPTSLEDLARELTSHQRVLCVVSDRKTCRELHSLMPEGTFHLSALMCGQHRSDIIVRIKAALNESAPVRVISTQLVEAGVDLDFPVVYRAMAGLDSIAQAAGRCNREGRLEGMGQVKVVVTPKKPPPGILRKAADTTVEQIVCGSSDPCSPESFVRFFDLLYGKANSLDSHGIVDLLEKDAGQLQLQFREAAEKFQIIDDKDQHAVFVPYGEHGRSLIEQLRLTGITRSLMRKLQRYSVTVYSRDFFALKTRGSVLEVFPDVFALNNDVEYSEITGLLVDEQPDDPGRFVC